MEHIVVGIILAVIALALYILGCLQFCGKGFLMNNAYIYADKKEREKMNKKPYYIQSGTIFCLFGIVFTLNALSSLLQIEWLSYCGIGLMIFGIIFAIVSSIIIEKKR